MWCIMGGVVLARSTSERQKELFKVFKLPKGQKCAFFLPALSVLFSYRTIHPAKIDDFAQHSETVTTALSTELDVGKNNCTGHAV